MSSLRRFLVSYPTLAWMLGFPLVLAPRHCFGFDVESSLPTQRHLTRMLRKIPNACLQFLLDETVRLLQAELATEIDDFGQCISLDTKHILAWVKDLRQPQSLRQRSLRQGPATTWRSRLPPGVHAQT